MKPQHIPIDFRRASRFSRIIWRSRSRRSLSSRSFVAAISSRIADVALNVSNGFAVSSDADCAALGGEAKSIKSPSWFWTPSFAFWLGVSRAGVRLRVSSKEGMFRTGETGTVGLRIDFRGPDVVDYNAPSSVYANARASDDTYLATIPIGILESIKPTRAQALTPRLLILGRKLRVDFKLWHDANVCRRILLIESRRHLRPRSMGNGAARARARGRRIRPDRHGNSSKVKSPKHGLRKEGGGLVELIGRAWKLSHSPPSRRRGTRPTSRDSKQRKP